MRYLHTIFTILLIAFSVFFSFGVKETFADITQVNEKSSSIKVEKLQEVLKGLGLYSGKIDGNFSTIKEILINYQVENGIISSVDASDAGYFGNKTIKSFKEKFGKKFEDLQKEYLSLEAPLVNNETYFIVTAYYSPIPGQEKYVTGSYEAEMKLNGGGNTASGKKPSAGTIAAPRNYAFGTKIELEGFGVGIVEDRGGAIVNSGDNGNSHDRLDVWMGYGDEARERTRLWGVKKVKGKILEQNTQVKVFFEDKINSSIVSVESEKNTQDIKNISEIEKYKNLYISPLNPDFESVKKLQELLKKTNLYFGEIDGDFSSIKNILIDYQVKNSIILSENSEEAGYFGKKTFDSFRKKFGENFELVQNISENEVKNIQIEVEQRKVEKKDLLTLKEKENILKIKTVFLENLSKKFSGNNLENEKNSIKEKIKKFSENIENEKSKAILEYFSENL